MKYSIRWSRRAVDALADIWLTNSGQRAEISQSAASIDSLLSVEPGEQGESRDGARRILFVPPLVANFTVDEGHRDVRILAIRFLKRRGKE